MAQIAGSGYGIALFFFYASYALGLWYASWLVKHLRLLKDYPGFHGIATDFIKRGRAMRSVFDLLDRKTETQPDDPSTIFIADRMSGEIEFKHVDFSYPKRPEVLIFHDMNLRARAGKTLWLWKYNLKSLLPHIANVPQEPCLFATTIYVNIAYGHESATESDIAEAATFANAHKFITFVGERGIELSGGQKPRIAIARALLTKSQIILIDEATSALDVESERCIQEALERSCAGKTTILVA